MKLKNKILAGLTAGITVFMSLGLHLTAADKNYYISEEDPRFKYEYIDESAKTISISANEQITGDLIIPSSLDGNTVTAIGEFGFSEQNKLTGIVIPETVTKIDSFAFNNCEALKNVSIPKTIISLGARPFVLTEYEETLEKEAESGFVLIDGYILYKYSGSDTDIVIPDGVKVIANSVFAYDLDDDIHINSIVFPDSVEQICEYAFWNCNSITSLTFGNSISSISINAFTVSGITVHGYLDTYPETFAKNRNLKFVPLIERGESRTEIVYSKELRQYYFSDEEVFSKDGIKVYTRNYNGVLTEEPNWNFTGTPGSLYNAGTEPNEPTETSEQQTDSTE